MPLGQGSYLIKSPDLCLTTVAFSVVTEAKSFGPPEKGFHVLKSLLIELLLSLLPADPFFPVGASVKLGRSFRKSTGLLVGVLERLNVEP